MVLGGIISAAGSIAGGLIGAKGQRDANKASAASVREQMAFQERMYKNRYNYQMQDMRKSGLNPLYSAVQSPGTAPSGAAYTAQNEMAPLGEGVSSAAGAFANYQQVRAQTKLTKKQAEVAAAQKANIAADTMLKNSTAREVEARTPTHATRIEVDESVAALNRAQAKKVNADRLLSVAREAMVQAETKLAERHAELADMDIRMINAGQKAVIEELKKQGVTSGVSQFVADVVSRFLLPSIKR